MNKSSPASPRPPSTRPHHDQESFGQVETTPFGPANLPSNLTLAACLYVSVRGSQHPSPPPHFKPNQVGGQDHARKRDHVRHQLDKQGVPLRDLPPQPTSDRPGAVAQSLNWLRDLASAAVKRLPALPDPLRVSGAEAATPPDDAYDEGTGQGIAILRYDIKGQRQPDETRNQDEAIRSLKRLFGPQNVYVIDARNQGEVYPYLANVADLPEGTTKLLLSGSGDPAYQDAVQRLKAYCEANDTPYELVPFPINFANILQAKGVLLVADAHYFTPSQRKQIERYYGHPKQVLYMRLVSFDDPLHDECFDVDLTALLMENQHGQGVAFINRKCFVLDPRDGLSISPDQAIAFFKAQGWIVIEVSDADRHQLALNAVFLQGKLLVTRKGLSERFLQDAAAAHVDVVFPVGDKKIGHDGSLTNPNGLGCITVRFPKTTGTPAPKKKEL
jgi:hypothetical protein